MSESPGPIPKMPDELFEELFEIVTDAGHLSREIRMCATVIYHWPPTFKDGTYVERNLKGNPH